MKKRFVSLLLAIGMILSLMPVSAVTAFAEGANNGAVKIIAEGNCGAENNGTNLSWKLESNGVLTISGDGAMKDYSGSYTFTRPGWYKNKDQITSVVFDGEITRIGVLAFDECANIENVRYKDYTGPADNALPESVKTIGQYAFSGTGVTGTLKLPENLTAIGYSAFSGCTKLTGSLTIPTGVKKIEKNTFYKCGFTGTLTIPEGVTTIGESAFEGCSSLTGDLKIPDTVIEVGRYAFHNCSGFQGKLFLSNSLSEICYGTFWGCSGLTGPLTIPKNVTKIDGCAFRECKHLTGDLNIPDTVIEVGGYAFEGCSGFDGTIYISKSLKKIEEATFKDCSSLKGTLTIPDGVTTIKRESFSNCSQLKGKLVIPDSVMEIYDASGSGSYKFCDGAFEDCTGFTALQLSNKLKRIPAYAFDGCSGLEGTLTIPDSVTEIGHCAFQGCEKLTGTLIIPNQVEKIEKSAFAGCTGLTGDLTIPKNVTTIEENAFYDCGFTGSVDLSQAENLTVIDKGTFLGCENLKKVYLSKHITAIKEDAFDRINRIGTAKIYYPAYKEDWLTLAKNVSDLNADKNAFISGYYYIKPMPVCYYCDVTFDPNGGTFADNTTAKTYQKIYRTELVATNEANASVPADPTRTGYAFNGWYYLDATQQEVRFDPATDGVPDTMTLYADWTQTGTTATVAISGIAAGQELIKGKEYPFTVTVTPNDDTGAGKLNFELLQNAELWYKNTAGQWEKVDNSTLNINFGTTEYQFKLVPKESGANTLTVGVQKDGMTTGAANKDSVSFTVRDPKAAEIAIADLNNQTIKQNKPHTFTVTVTANDDSGNATLTFDNVAGLTYNGTAVTDAGVTVALTKNQSETLNFTLTPSEAGNKILTATLSNSAANTADYTVSEYVNAEVTIDGLDGTTVKAGEAKEFTVNVTPNDDANTGAKATITVSGADAVEKIQYKDGETWKDVPGEGLSIDKINNTEFKLITKADANDGDVTITVTAKKADGTEAAKNDANFTVTAREHATVKINELNGKTIKQNKPYTFTVTVTAHDDSGNATLTFDNVAGLTYNGTAVTDAGVTVALTKNQSETLNFTLTPSEAGNKILTATLSNSAANTADYTVSEYVNAEVTIDGLDGTTVKAGEAKEFTVNVTPNDDTIDKVTFGTTSGKVQWSNDGGKTWTTVSGDVDYSDLTGKQFRVVPAADAANGTVTVTVIAKKADGTEVARKDASFTVTKKEEPVTPGGGSTGDGENPGENPGGGSTGGSENPGENPGSGSTTPKRKLEIADGTLTSVTVKDENGNLKDITDTITKDLDGKYEIPVGAKVTITAKDAPEGMKFGEWSISDKTLLSDPDVPYTEKDLIFTMPDNPDGVKLSVVYLEESIGEEPNLLEKGALAGTVVVGSAALLYQGHMLGTELYLRYLLPHGAVIPQNRAELAVLLWQDAENPEPVSTTLYSDISDEDSAIQQAARWAVENDLMEQLDADEHPDHFDPFVPATFSDSIRAWKKAQELKKSVH